MNRLDAFDCHYLDQNLTLDQEIDTVGAIDSDATVDEWKGLLALHRQASLDKLVGESCLVSRFKESRTKLPMNRDRCPNNLLGQLILVLSHRVITS